MVTLEDKYQDDWFASAVKENDTDRVVRLLELGMRPTDESLVDDALSAGNCEMAALLRKHGAPLNTQVTALMRHWKKWKAKGAGAARLALWEYVECKKESDLVRVRPLRKWAILRHWVGTRAVVFYWKHRAAMPESQCAERAAKRFKAAAIAE